MSNFDYAVDIILEHEGGYVDHKDDPGGATNYGITEKVARENGYDGDMRDLSLTDAKRIYHEQYWKPVHGNKLPRNVALNVFDAAVNHGVRQAVKFLQRAVGAVDDGIIGPKTIKAVQQVNEVNTVMRFHAERIRFYTSLDTFDTFGRGWMNRMATNIEQSVYE